MANIAAAAQYAPIVRAEAERNGLAPALLAGLVDHETGSTWNPRASRFEGFNPATTADDDASRGLTQLLFRSAQGIGYTGTPEGLFHPATNLFYGAKYLAAQIARAGSVQGGLSSYNGGYRPGAGFGAPLRTARLGIVLARDKNGRPTSTRDAPAGEYANQPYVDSVMSRARIFAASLAWNAAAGTAASKSATVAQLLTPTRHAAPGIRGPARPGGAGRPAAKLAIGAGLVLGLYLLWRVVS